MILIQLRDVPHIWGGINQLNTLVYKIIPSETRVEHFIQLFKEYYDV